MFAETHQGLGDAVLLADITKICRPTGLKPDVVPDLGVVLKPKDKFK